MTNTLDNPINWSFRVGTLFGVRIKVHLLFVLGGLVILAHEVAQDATLYGLTHGLGGLALLFVIVLVHEFGHCFGARYVGGQADEILMWPLGGLAFTSPPHNPRAHLITAVAGPAVNVVFLAITATALATLHGGLGAVPWNPFTPYATSALVTTELQYWLVVFFTLNYIILLFNLAPVFPLDGGRIVQCVLWYRHGFTQATLTATGVGMVGAIVIGVIGIFSGDFLFFAIAGFGYFTCWQQRQLIRSGIYGSENEFGYDFSQGYTSLEGSTRHVERRPSFWQRWRTRRAIVRERREAQRLEERRREIDRILHKVHEHGLAALTPKERRLLEEETHRHRSQ